MAFSKRQTKKKKNRDGSFEWLQDVCTNAWVIAAKDKKQKNVWKLGAKKRNKARNSKHVIRKMGKTGAATETMSNFIVKNNFEWC